MKRFYTLCCILFTLCLQVDHVKGLELCQGALESMLTNAECFVVEKKERFDCFLKQLNDVEESLNFVKSRSNNRKKSLEFAACVENGTDLIACFDEIGDSLLTEIEIACKQAYDVPFLSLFINVKSFANVFMDKNQGYVGMVIFLFVLYFATGVCGGVLVWLEVFKCAFSTCSRCL